VDRPTLDREYRPSPSRQEGHEGSASRAVRTIMHLASHREMSDLRRGATVGILSRTPLLPNLATALLAGAVRQTAQAMQCAAALLCAWLHFASTPGVAWDLIGAHCSSTRLSNCKVQNGQSLGRMASRLASAEGGQSRTRSQQVKACALNAFGTLTLTQRHLTVGEGKP
jgi:hypothetical protein